MNEYPKFSRFKYTTLIDLTFDIIKQLFVIFILNNLIYYNNTIVTNIRK